MKPIAKAEIIKKFAEKHGITMKEANAQWDAVTSFLVEEVVAGNNVLIRGLGTIGMVEQPATECRVPGTDRIVAVPARKKVKLRGKTYREE
jgi:DNA-binding protein HU-beta